MEIKIDKEPCFVIKHYKVSAGNYDVFLIHNETTGEIEMTSVGMSINSYNNCVDEVIGIFKNQIARKNKEMKEGDKVKCLNDEVAIDEHTPTAIAFITKPEKSETYTVRDIVKTPYGTGIRLEEIRNKEIHYDIGGLKEPIFAIEHFEKA